jgi:energy-converting hydrogenase B subunit Q
MNETLESKREPLGLIVETESGPGVLHQLSGVIARMGGNITWVVILGSERPSESVFFEIEGLDGLGPIIDELLTLPMVLGVSEEKTLKRVFGKRVIIMGGGAQVGQVAVGAVAEADRHNLRGERISVDTIPLVGEDALAEAVLAASRLPRARVLVLAGAIMGGEIESAVRTVRKRGLIVVSLNMAGSVPEAADLVVTDPIQAGVMAVMAIAETAAFRVDKLKKTKY